VKTETAQKSENSLDRYSYRENKIEPAQSTTIREKISDASEDLESFEKNVIQTVAEDLSVDEKEVRDALETLGLTAFDLLVPQNLAQVVTQVTGEESPADLLVNAQFTALMQDMDQLGSQLVQTLDVEPDQLSELVAQMDQLSEPLELTGEEAQTVIETLDAQEPMQEAAVQPTQPKMEQQPTEPDQLSEEEAVPEQSVPETENAQAFSKEQTGEEPTGENHAGESRQAKPSQIGRAAQDQPQTATAFNPAEVTVEDIPVPEAENSSYLSVDAMDLIEQIAENVRVSVSEGTTSMEMQLNPENLGKIYLQISAKEGVVNANITASNEAVRAALEAQVADLRQSLNQAGVKVDAIEVTVASHEFEQNLEQNFGREEQEGERQQAQASQRRNINLSSLDELSGVMTEEEALVAQIMRDNGNSVDLTA
jgi:flagellar hook-length control protein FliK